MNLAWIDASSGYQITLEPGSLKLICRNSKGKTLASVPKTVRESAEAERLLGLKDWLLAHDKECAATVERWLLRSLPVPKKALAALWPDPSWRGPLQNLLAVPVEAGLPHWESVGIFREASEKRGIGLVDLDGESHWLDSPAVLFPHPILVPELAEFRELLVELQLSQATSQLFRESWALPPEEVKSVNEFSGGKFQQVLHAHGRCRTQGFPVRGGFAICGVWQAGQVFEARFWVGAGSPEEETVTGELVWVDRKERSVTAREAGPVAYSEGMRMASLIYAGRAVEKEQD
jgi:hypothetical protein